MVEFIGKEKIEIDLWENRHMETWEHGTSQKIGKIEKVEMKEEMPYWSWKKKEKKSSGKILV